MSLSCTATARDRIAFRRDALFLATLWLATFFASLFTPPLLDDADATHAQAAQAMLRTHDFVTLHVDGIRYLEKAPLPYWITALCMALFGQNTFAVHLQLALTILALAALGYRWAARAFDRQTAFLTALFTLTSAGAFLFTRVFIPDALLSLLLAVALYTYLRTQDPTNPRVATSAYLFWTSLALAVLTKGLVAIVFIAGTILLFTLITRKKTTNLHPIPGLALFFAIAAPWHILAGLRNTNGANNHGFFWFYFINEHVLRFLGRRIPRDYNKLPTYLYWTLHLIWLFPWSLFAPAALATAFHRWKTRPTRSTNTLSLQPKTLSFRPKQDSFTSCAVEKPAASQPPAQPTTFTHQTTLLLTIFSTLVLIFFSLSTNQEYYTFPSYLPLLMLLAAALTHTQHHRLLTASFATFTAIGLTIAAILAAGLYVSRHLPYNPDIGSALAHRDVGNYTLSMSHFFDLTGASFAALRFPAALAALAFALGPITALLLWLKRRNLRESLTTIALTTALFLIAAHIAFVRFNPMLSSEHFAHEILTLEATHRIEPTTQIAIFGDQAFGSSIPFYLHRNVLLIDGRSTSMLFGSAFPDAPPIFLTHNQLVAQWGQGPRKILFVPLEQRDTVAHLLGPHTIPLDEQSGKQLLTDRPLLTPP
jgi:4-amino-4-deoxy-L-arabinose transferase-like glycosyltransferase